LNFVEPPPPPPSLQHTKEDHVKVAAATRSNCLLQSDGLSHSPPKAPLDGRGRPVGSRKQAGKARTALSTKKRKFARFSSHIQQYVHQIQFPALILVWQTWRLQKMSFNSLRI